MKLKWKSTLFFFIGVLLLSFLPFLSILTTSLYPHTQDGLVHLARMAAYFRTITDGEFPVRWAGYLNYGYGMPLFDFIYQVPYFISSFFLLLHVNLVTTYKLVLVVSFLLSGVFAFLFSKELFGGTKKALLFTLFYQFAPFRLVELFVRGDIGEVYTYTFLPLVCFGLVKLSKKISFGTIALTSLATALLILSHNSVSLSFFAVAALFVFFLPFTKKSLMSSFLSLGIGLLLSMFYWAPALFDHKYTFGDLFMKNLYLQHFVPFQNFFIPNFFNSPSLRMGGVPIQIGLFHVVAIIVALIVLIWKKIDTQTKKIFIFSFILLIASFFLMQPVSNIVWAHVSLLRQFQFPWRLLSVVVFATSLLSVSFLEVFFVRKVWVYVFLLALVVGSTYWYWRPTYGWDRVNEDYYWHYPLTSTYYGETDVIWTQGQATAFPKSPVEFAAGNGTVSRYWKNSYQQNFQVAAKTKSTLVDHTEYFPGWKVYVNGVQTPIQFQDQNYRGQITFQVPTGKSTIKVIFEETPLRLISDIFSLITLIGLAGLFVIRKVRYGKK
ncbi:MAG TPA: 6-pyruvoyl-tetrahydropterin synthase-related protein [Candidatus Saccharimonadales bacterium]|nr:6-pyruvoyl-tetrahydropterin synthase-related protein [Candidatus Saccharimonadales bacterium]